MYADLTLCDFPRVIARFSVQPLQNDLGTGERVLRGHQQLLLGNQGNHKDSYEQAVTSRLSLSKIHKLFIAL